MLRAVTLRRPNRGTDRFPTCGTLRQMLHELNDLVEHPVQPEGPGDVEGHNGVLARELQHQRVTPGVAEGEVAHRPVGAGPAGAVGVDAETDSGGVIDLQRHGGRPPLDRTRSRSRAIPASPSSVTDATIPAVAPRG